MNTSRPWKRRIARAAALTAAGASALVLTAVPSMAAQKCTGAAVANVCLAIDRLSNGEYAVHLGIDWHISKSDAAAIILGGGPLTAEMIGDDAFSDDHLFTVPLTDAGASDASGLSIDFDRVVPASFLDEDDTPFDRVDEVFGRIRITDRRTNTTQTFDTPEFVQRF
ncbi:hypothetical protein SAMN05421504_102732 [Amycolatopsis xylanica]|uniref:Uncharacterized protein n=1 Tax=Amycolatopsis xylanica TaxID=589385 RepID=A0A1H3A1F0_9PSEU|nr:hypothetical protein [Amycolatopsis xylanica]SDX22749.1 hypothetical protein SAMN05421504_102732 [Amycolatopsis xylanica]